MEMIPCLKLKNQISKRITFIGRFVALLLFLATQSLANEGVEALFAIKAGRIITVTQDVIENGTIIIKNGIIEAVGKDIPIPVGAEIINVDTMSVYPGLIDAHTSLALKQPKATESTQDRSGAQTTQSGAALTSLSPEQLAENILNPKDSKIAKVRETGVTTVLTVPSRGIFIGQSALINLSGDKPEAMVLKSPIAMHMGYSGQRGVYPSTLMAVIAYQRQTFYDAQHHKFLWDRYSKQKRGWRRPVSNKSLDALIPVLKKQMPVIISANRENEIKRALRLANEFDFDYLISGATEGWRTIDLLTSLQKPVLLSLNFPKPENVTGYSFKLKVEGTKKDKVKEKGKKEEDEKEMAELYANAGVLHKAGVKFGFTSGGLKKPADFIKNAAKTIKHGLPKQEALKALTIYPAEIFGVADQIGSIEDGKIANLVVATGCIFDDKTKIKYIFIDGKKYEIKIEEKKKKDEGEPKVDVTGTWDVTVDSPQGEIAVTLILKQTGSEVTGDMKSEFGAADVYDGSVSGNKIEFSVKLPIAAEPVEIIFEGTVEENTIEGTIDLGPMGTVEWSATKPGMWSYEF